MVEPVSLQTSLVQAVAAEKVTHVESHHGDANQQLFAAELAKLDEQRARDVQSTAKSEEEQRIDAREKKRREERDREEEEAEEDEFDPGFGEGMLTAGDEINHLIDITV